MREAQLLFKRCGGGGIGVGQVGSQNKEGREEDGDATAMITGEFTGGKRIPVGTWLGFVLCLIRFSKKGRIMINNHNHVSQWCIQSPLSYFKSTLHPQFAVIHQKCTGFNSVTAQGYN